jgi:hypothetical protein
MESPLRSHPESSAPFAIEVLLYGIAHRLPVANPAHRRHEVNAFADHPGGGYTCRWFGERVSGAVWCGYPRAGHVRSQAKLGCAFWQREPGSDD